MRDLFSIFKPLFPNISCRIKKIHEICETDTYGTLLVNKACMRSLTGKDALDLTELEITIEIVLGV